MEKPLAASPRPPRRELKRRPKLLLLPAPRWRRGGFPPSRVEAVALSVPGLGVEKPGHTFASDPGADPSLLITAVLFPRLLARDLGFSEGKETAAGILCSGQSFWAGQRLPPFVFLGELRASPPDVARGFVKKSTIPESSRGGSSPRVSGAPLPHEAGGARGHPPLGERQRAGRCLRSTAAASFPQRCSVSCCAGYDQSPFCPDSVWDAVGASPAPLSPFREFGLFLVAPQPCLALSIPGRQGGLGWGGAPPPTTTLTALLLPARDPT